MTELETKLSQILVEKQSKIIPENIKKDIQIFDITGTYEGNSGGVKLFETEEQMQQDPNANEGDLAVVYREEIQNMTVDTQTQYITFPETVILPSAITEFYYCMLRAVDTSIMFDGDIQLTQSSFRFGGFAETGMIRVQYESEDGITYNRTRFTGDSGDLTNPVDLGTTIQVHMSEEWNDNFGYFMQVGGMYFDGLYDFRNYLDKDYFRFIPISNIDFASGTPVWNGIYTSEKYSVADVQAVVKQMKNDGAIINTYGLHSFIDSDNDLIISENLPNRYVINISGNLIGMGETSTSSNTYKLYKIDLASHTYSLKSTKSKVGTLTVSNNDRGTFDIMAKTIQVLIYIDYPGQDVITRYQDYSGFYLSNSLSGTATSTSMDFTGSYYDTYNKYQIAPTQLTTTKDYVYNSIYYGKDGVNEGTLTQAPANTFNDVNAEVHYKLMQAYDNMKPVKVQNGQNFQNAYFISNSKGESLLDLSEVTSTEKMFQNNNYIINCPSLNTDNVSNMSYMFSGCSNLISISELNTNNAIDMTAIFQSCESLINVPSIDTNNVTNMGYMFGHCYSLQSIPQLNTSNVTNMTAMFNHCDKLTTIPLLDTSNVTSMDNMFSGCSNLQSIPQLNTGSVTDMGYMFRDCFNLTTIPLLDTSNVTTMINMFNGCTNLTTIPLLDTSNVTGMFYMFCNCTNLTSIPELNTQNVTNMNSMFINCTSLTTIPLLNTSKVTRMTDMFNSCINLTSIPLLDTSKVTNMNSMFLDCINLTTIPLLDTSNVDYMQDIFSNCPNLLNESLNNILQMCSNSQISSSSYKTLKYIGLSEEQVQKCTTLSNWSALEAKGWTTGY